MRAALLVAVVALASCARCGASGTATGTSASGSTSTDTAVPVKVAAVERRDLRVVVTAQGRTEATATEEIRAPFDGVVTDLAVKDGDHVAQGETIAQLESRESEAALVGAEQMAQTANTPRERRDAARALALARRGVVKRALSAPMDAVVISHKVSAGGRVAANDVVLTLVALHSIVFVGEVPQNDLKRVQPGDEASVDLASSPTPIAGTVQGVLPAASPANMTAPVRVDLPPERAPAALNIFGVAHITVAVEHGAVVVPNAAIMRNDVMGTSRVAVVEADGRARFIEVKPGISEEGVTQIVSRALAQGTQVVVSGQVGLQDGEHVEVSP